MKKLLVLLALFIPALSQSQIVITNTHWAFGTNGFNFYSANVVGTRLNTLYMLQTSTNLSGTNWFNEPSSVFSGSDHPYHFTYYIDSGNTNKFFRVVEMGDPDA